MPDQPEPEGEVESPFTYMPENEFKGMVANVGYELMVTLESSSGYRPINEHRIVGGAFLYRQNGS